MPKRLQESLERCFFSFLRRAQKFENLDQEFDKLALWIFQFQYHHNKYYRAFCDLEKRSPSNVLHWKKIPAMPVAAFKDLPLTTFPLKHPGRYFETSGTSRGKKGRHYFEALRLYEASVRHGFGRAFFGPSRRWNFYFLMDSPKDRPHSSLSHMTQVLDKEFSRHRARYYVKKGQPQFKSLAVDLKAATAPCFLFSTAFALRGFLDHLEKSKVVLRLPVQSIVMDTGGFKGHGQAVSGLTLRRLCHRSLGVQPSDCVSEFGMTELFSQCYGRKIFYGPPWMRTRVIDPKTGQEQRSGAVGLLRHFDLANKASVMALQTEDLGRQVGLGFEFLGRAPGSELRGCSLSYEHFLKTSPRF